MKITMTQTKDGSSNGVHVHTYFAGQTYEVSDDLGSVFKQLGVCTDELSAEGNDEDDTDGNGTIDELEKLTVAHLKEVAADEDIDLGTATKKADIIIVITEARAAAKDDGDSGESNT